MSQIEYTYSCINGCGRTVTGNGDLCSQCSVAAATLSDGGKKCKDCGKDMGVGYAYAECNACWSKKGGGNYSGGGFLTYVTCTHTPKKVYSTRHYRIYGAKKFDIPTNAKLDLLLNLTSLAASDEVVLPKGYEELAAYVEPHIPEILLAWPDMATPSTPFSFWHAFTECLIKNSKQAGRALRVCVCCAGGHGRTGTGLAALIMTDMGHTAGEAMAYVRKHYCKHAIEAAKQENYLAGLDKFLAKAGK